MWALISTLPSAVAWLNDEKALVSTTVADPTCFPAGSLVGVVPPPFPAQALNASAVAAATPIALEIRPRRIPPPMSLVWDGPLPWAGVRQPQPPSGEVACLT